MKKYLDINIPYWFNKKLNIILWVIESKNSKKLILILWLYYKDKYLFGCDHWFLSKRDSFVLWKWKI